LKNKFYILIITFFSTISLLAQDVEFKAKVNLQKLGRNERLRIEFTMNQDGDNFTPPAFKNFTIVGGPSQTTSRQWINGKGSFSKSFSYFITPNKQGTLTIEPAQITVNGTVYKSQPITVTVTAPVDKPTDPNDPTYIAREKIHLVAEVSKGRPYLNEHLTVVYKLYVAANTSVSNWREVESPKFADFWSQSIDEQQFKVYDGEYKGEPHRYVILRRTVLYPQKTGKLEIEPLKLDVAVVVPTNRRDIFGRPLTKNANITVSAKKRIVDVKPFPEQGKPDNFTGAVGDFDFTVNTDKTQLDAGDALQLSVEINGRGNLKLFDLPEPVLPSTLEVYEPENGDKIRTNLAGMSGLKKQTYTIVPQYKGNYPVPPLSFSYFNPSTKKYETKTSKDLIIDVVNGPVDNNTTTNENSATQEKVVESDSQFEFIKRTTILEPLDKDPFFKSTLFWILLITPFFFIPAAMLLRKKRQAYVNDVTGNRIRKADKLARKFLSTAKKNLGNQKEFYIAMERALHNYLKAKLSITTSEMSKDRISRLLKEREVDSNTIIEFISLLESCEFARYTPSSNTAMQQDYDKAARVISQLDKQL